MKIVQLPSKVGHRGRRKPLVCHIIHTTGDTDHDKIVRYYQADGTNHQGIGPHYYIAYDGTIYQFVPESEVAYHAGYTGDGDDNQKAIYEKGREVWTRRINEAPWILKTPFVGYNTWFQRWGDEHQSPLTLVTAGAPNDSSIGIEIQEPEHRQPEKFFDAQYISLIELLKTSAARNGLLLDRKHVLGHYDVNPIVRAGKDGDRDPGEAFNWQRVLSTLR